MYVNVKFSSKLPVKIGSYIHDKQTIVDNAVLRYMDPYIPYQTGALAKSAVIGTVIGSGKIVMSMPYARYLYYGVVYGPNYPITKGGETVGFYSPASKTSTGRPLSYDKTKHPLAGKLWFERMKKDHLKDIKKEADIR